MAIYNKVFNETDWAKVNEVNISILDDFILECRQQQKKPSTLKQYYNDGRIILIYILHNCKNQSILELTKKNFRNFSLWLTEEKGMSSARTNRMMSCLRSMLTFCEEDDEDYGEYEQNMAAKVKGIPSESVRDIVFISDEEINRMIDTLIEREEYQKATLVSLLYDSAGRKNEVAQVEKYSFLDPGKSYTNVVTGKRGKKFTLLYFSRTKECAKLWLEQRGEDDIPSMWILRNTKNPENRKPISPDTIYSWIVGLRKLYKELEGKDILLNVHSIRHISLENYSTGNHSACREFGEEEGFPLERLKLIAHHESIETTSNYLKDKSSQELSSMFGGIDVE